MRIDLLEQAWQERNLIQEQLGNLVGVQKAQFFKIENSVKNARVETILKFFDALGAEVNFNAELNSKKGILTKQGSRLHWLAANGAEGTTRSFCNLIEQ